MPDQNKIDTDKETVAKAIKKIEGLQDATAIVKAVEEMLQSLADQKAKTRFKIAIPTLKKLFGVYHPTLNIIAQKLAPICINKPELGLAVLNQLWQRGYFEEQVIAVKILNRYSKKFPQPSLKFIHQISRQLTNWAICDILATYGVRNLIDNQVDIFTQLTTKYIPSSNKWTQRFAIVTLVELARHPEIQITKQHLNILKPYLQSTDLDIKKAIVWVYKRAYKSKPLLVKSTIAEYENSTNPNVLWIINQVKKVL